MSKRMEGSPHKNHEDHIAGKGMHSLSHKNLVHTCIPVPQARKIPDAKAAVEKEWEELAKILAWQLPKVRNKNEVGDRWSKEWGQNCTRCVVNGSLSFQKFGAGATVSKIQRSSRTPRWDIVKDDSGLFSIYRTRIISITNDCSISNERHIHIARVRRTSSGRRISLYPGKNWRCSKTIENSEIGMSRHLDSSTTTQMAQIMAQYGRSSRSSWATSVWSSFGRTIVGKAIPMFQIGNACSLDEKKYYSCLCMWTI